MAIATNTFTTFSAIGNREDLADTISNISPEDTPFMSSIGKTTADATYTEWQTDALAAADNTNAQLQGDDVTTYDAVTPTIRVGNRTQISRKTAVVSGTQERVDKAGRKSEMAYQLSKKSAELKRDMETILIGTAQAAVTGATGTAPKTAAMLSWIKTNVDMGASGVNPAWTSGAPSAARTDGTARTFTETLLKNVLQLCFTAGAQPTTIMLGPSHKGTFSAFSGIATRFRDVGSKQQAQIIGAADIYVGDFGEYAVVPNRFQRERDCWVLDPKMAAVAYLRPFMKKQLATTGDAEKNMLLVEYALKVKNEAAFGLVADLT